jgi:ubiquinone/menaquinone biosynthesis C-methylase UbiE
MKSTLNVLSSFLLVILSAFTLPERPKFSSAIYGNIANFFETEQELVEYFQFKKRETIAEVGAGDAQNIAGLSLLTDSITYYAEDIDTKALNEKNLAKALKKCSRYKNTIGSIFKICIGTEKETKLPDQSFDKVILSSTFHEFSFVPEMLNDIYIKLKAGGRLYILESQCGAKAHRYVSAESAIEFAKNAHFKLIKKDGRDLHGSVGLYRLVFEK